MTLPVADVLITVKRIKRPRSYQVEIIVFKVFLSIFLGLLMFTLLQQDIALEGMFKYDYNKTLTTPMPDVVPTDCKLKSDNTFIIEKYDAQKVHAKIMANKIRQMTEKLPKDIFERINKEVQPNEHHHMMYVNNYNKKLNGKKTFRPLNERIDDIIYMQNIDTAHNMGCGVIVIEYPFYQLTDRQDSNRRLMKRFFDLVPNYSLKISIILKNQYKRNIVSFKKEVHSFLKSYGKHPALYKYQKDNSSAELPVIYIMGSFNIQHDKWYNLLSPNSKTSLRGSEYDAIFLGQVRDAEHIMHVKKSKFDGFFTCCQNNGEYYGNTWRNWDYLSSWADSTELLWSTGVVEGSEGVLSLKAALNTVLRLKDEPTFVLFNNINYRSEVITIVQNWNDITSNLNGTNQRFL